MKVVLEHPAFVWDSNHPRTLPIGFSDCLIVPQVTEKIVAWYLVRADENLEWIQDKDIIVKLDKKNYIILRGDGNGGPC